MSVCYVTETVEQLQKALESRDSKKGIGWLLFHATFSDISAK